MPPSRSHDDYPIPPAQLSNSELEARLYAKREAEFEASRQVERAGCVPDNQSLGRQLWTSAKAGGIAGHYDVAHQNLSTGKQDCNEMAYAKADEPSLIDYAMRASEELSAAQGNLDHSLASIGLASSPEEGVEQNPAGELRIWLRRVAQQAMQLRVQSERLRSLL